jgi:hypothetical protein
MRASISAVDGSTPIPLNASRVLVVHVLKCVRSFRSQEKDVAVVVGSDPRFTSSLSSGNTKERDKKESTRLNCLTTLFSRCSFLMIMALYLSLNACTLTWNPPQVFEPFKLNTTLKRE